VSNGKESLGKIPVATPADPAPDDGPWGGSMNTSGVYMFTPSGGTSTQVQKETVTVIKKIEKIKRVPVCDCTKS
jgi:hypothetical protein